MTPVDRAKTDTYFMRIAEAVESGANCLGTQVGAVLVVGNRVISTGYNGTPTGFPNCRDGGCVRCYDSWLLKQDRKAEMSDPQHQSGQALDRCVCVHAEQNAILTAARFGIRVQDATLYTTQSPCMGCLKEAYQAGVVRIVYKSWYPAKYNDALRRQYEDLADHLAEHDATRFEPLGGAPAPVTSEGQPDPYEDESGQATELKPPFQPD